MAYPNRIEAEKLLIDAERYNPGKWVNHSRIAAHCAEQIARKCQNMDPHKAYVFGLMHDIGRKFGVKHLAHVYDGYEYMNELGYDEVARICLTHSFCLPTINTYIGNFDISKKQQDILEHMLQSLNYDYYDLLIQLCDCLAGSEGVVDMEQRMLDVKQRYGFYPQEKWDRNMDLKAIFEKRCGCNIYEAVR